jgi:Mrp family chromosome partitioning ATPase
MSTTNRAFIKAYRQDTAAESPLGGNSPALLKPGAAPARDAAEGTIATTTAVSNPTRPTLGPKRSGPKQPLSSFIGRQQTSPQPPGAGQPTQPAVDASFLEPGTTVASFQWPKVCRALNQQAAPQLDRVADLLRAQASAGHSLVGVLGMFPRVGATTAALCLAARAARRVRRILLADGNFCHPRIAPWLDVVPTVGWEEVLKHSAPLSDAVIRATDDNLDILALGHRASREPQLLASGMQAAVTAGVLRHAYDLVLVDLGAFFDPISQPVVLELIRNSGIDTVVAVAGPEAADPRDVATIIEYLEPLNCQLMGTIENRVAKPPTA